VQLYAKPNNSDISEKKFMNELLAQSVRHEIYCQTKNIRELMLARAVATSVISKENPVDEEITTSSFSEDEILKDWFEE
jgi:hypothetical protein